MIQRSRLWRYAPRLASAVVGLRRWLHTNPSAPKVFNLPPPRGEAGSLLITTPNYEGEGVIGITSQNVLTFPEASAPYSPTNLFRELPRRILAFLERQKGIALYPAKVVPDDINEFKVENFLDWWKKEYRLFTQCSVWFNHKEKLSGIFDPYAAITNTMINVDGNRHNKAAIYIPGSNCRAFFTVPTLNPIKKRWHWREGIKGQFAGEELALLLYQAVASSQVNQSSWFVKEFESEAVRMAYNMIKAAIPAPSVSIENFFIPDNEEGTKGWLYMIGEKTCFPDYKKGTQFITASAPDPPAYVQEMRTQYLSPLIGLMMMRERFLLSYRYQDGLFTPLDGGPLFNFRNYEDFWSIQSDPEGTMIELYPESIAPREHGGRRELTS